MLVSGGKVIAIDHAEADNAAISGDGVFKPIGFNIVNPENKPFAYNPVEKTWIKVSEEGATGILAVNHDNTLTGDGNETELGVNVADIVDDVFLAVDNEKITFSDTVIETLSAANELDDKLGDFVPPPSETDDKYYGYTNGVWKELPMESYKLSDTITTAVNAKGETELQSNVSMTMHDGLLEFNNAFLR